MSYANILVAVDLTEEADEVVDTASKIAQAQQAKLNIATVVRPLSSYYGGLDMALLTNGAVRFETEAVEQATKQLKKIASTYHLEDDCIHVALGHPSNEIRTLAKQLASDLVVIGTHGRHGLGVLLGSTANGVLQRVDCDVLAVKIHPMNVS